MTYTTTNNKQILFIDAGVADLQSILTSLPPSIDYFLLDANQDGLQQMTDILAGYSDLDAIHIISHGSPGALQLGNTWLTQATLDDHSTALSSIGSALTETGDLLLYGCDVARGDVGQAFIQQLAAVTGADVAASEDLTGAANAGGDWILESSTGKIESTTITPRNDLASVLSVNNSLVTSNLMFSAIQQSIWGLDTGYASNHTFDQLLWTTSGGTYANDVNLLPGSWLTPKVDFACSVDINQIQIGPILEVGIGAGVFDLSYPISAQLGLPTKVLPGDSFSIATGTGSVNSAYLTVDGPGLDISLSLRAQVDCNGYFELQSNDSPLFSVSVEGTIGGDLKLFDISEAGFLSGDYFAGYSRDNNIYFADEVGGRKILRSPFASIN